MGELFKNVPQIIREAAQNSYGLAALIILVLGVVVFLFFQKEKKVSVKFGAFILLAVVFIGALVLVILSAKQSRTSVTSLPASTSTTTLISTPIPIRDNVTVNLISAQVGRTQIGGPEDTQKNIEYILNNTIRERLKRSCFRDAIQEGLNVKVVFYVYSEGESYAKAVSLEFDRKDIVDNYTDCVTNIFTGTLFPKPMKGERYQVKTEVIVVP